MRILFLAAIFLAPMASMAETSATAPVKDVLAKVAKVESFSADLEIREGRDPSREAVATSTLTVHRTKGWRLEGGPQGGEHIVVNDYSVSHDYYPFDKTAFRVEADTPALRNLFRRPADEINPLNMLDQSSMEFVGEEMFEGTPVFHFRGTTTTQVNDAIPASRRTLDAWIGKQDGLPRKTVEKTEFSVATTIYRNVVVNPQLPEGMFKFDAPADVKVIDVRQPEPPAPRPAPRAVVADETTATR